MPFLSEVRIFLRSLALVLALASRTLVALRPRQYRVWQRRVRHYVPRDVQAKPQTGNTAIRGERAQEVNVSEGGPASVALKLVIQE